MRMFRARLTRKLASALLCQLFALGSGWAGEQLAYPGFIDAPDNKKASEPEQVVKQILQYFPIASDFAVHERCNLQDPGRQFVSRDFALEGRCTSLSESGGCAYYDYRKLDLGKLSGFDQRDITSYQVTFPGTRHLWAALSVRNSPESLFCWVGGAHVGRNPLSMTWSGDTGTKQRKNNLVLSESGVVQVENARIHNLHDIFLASTRDAGIHVSSSWITWNRDDFFEGYLQDVQVTDTLVDGTYTFISDPDGDCDEVKQASDKTILIEDSLIRLQRQPGPYARHTGKWHWKIAGGHNTLWKLDSCDWDNWPKFILRNNVFLIEGPRTTRKVLNTIDCRLALPGECGDSALRNVGECRNNLFMYTDYHHWREADAEPGPVPLPGGRFYNADNPQFLPNGVDCYQRLSDDRQSAGFAPVTAIWQALRKRWIDWHTDPGNVVASLMKIPGVDSPVFQNNSRVRLQNRQSGECLTSSEAGQISMRRCDGTEFQLFQVETFNDGKLMAAVLLKDAGNRYLRTQSPLVLQDDDSGKLFDGSVYSEPPLDGSPGFSERWYILPLDEPGDATGFFGLESDALGRSFLRQSGVRAEIQGLYADGVNTALPQKRFPGGNNAALQWRVIPASR